MTGAVNIKKVQPYPIEAHVTIEAGTHTAKVIKVNTKGLFLEDQHIYRAGEKLKVNFEIPVLKYEVSATVVIRRMLDRYLKRPDGHGVQRLQECHFEEIDNEAKQQIFRFMNLIQQKD